MSVAPASSGASSSGPQQLLLLHQVLVQSTACTPGTFRLAVDASVGGEIVVDDSVGARLGLPRLLPRWLLLDRAEGAAGRRLFASVIAAFSVVYVAIASSIFGVAQWLTVLGLVLEWYIFLVLAQQLNPRLLSLICSSFEWLFVRVQLALLLLLLCDMSEWRVLESAFYLSVFPMDLASGAGAQHLPRGAVVASAHLGCYAALQNQNCR